MPDCTLQSRLIQTDMIRVMLSILAVMVLAVTAFYQAGEGNLYLRWVPGALLIVVAALAWIIPWLSARRARVTDGLAEFEESEEESLEEMGIMNIRPQDQAPVESDAKSEAEGEAPPEMEDARRIPGQHSILPDPLEASVLGPVLEGIRVSMGAHAVGLIRKEGTDGTFFVLGTAGRSWAKLRGDTCTIGHELLPAPMTVAIHAVSEKGVPSRFLTYSSRPGAIKRVAAAAIGHTNMLLLIDTLEDYALTHPRTAELLEQYAQTLSVLLFREDPQRPRWEIIAEEIARARTLKEELALALVWLSDADAIANAGQSYVSKAEEQLEQLLNVAAPSSRVVLFGELTFGVFTNGLKEELDAWYGAVRECLAKDEGLLRKGVTVGVAVLNASHMNADDFREDALRALEQAYKSDDGFVVA